MSLFTKTANDVFAPQDSGGAARSVDNQEAQVWGTEVEGALSLAGAFNFASEAEFLASRIPAPVTFVVTAGYASIGDGGGHMKMRISTPSPVEAWHKQSADGAWWEIANATICPKMFGAKGDAGGGSDGAITGSDATFTSASSSFSASDIGKRISIAGAGTAGAVHTTTIASLNSATSVELTVAAVTTVLGAKWTYGTDDTAEIQAAANMGRNVDFGWGDYLVSAKITVNNAGQRFFASGYPRVTAVDGRSARILVDNATLDYVFHCTQTNNTFEGFRVSAEITTTAEAFLFQRASGSASDIDARLIDMSIEGLTNGATVSGRGLHVKRCEFGNLTRGIALDWPASWTPNGLDNDLQETGARSYMIEDCLFHGTATWVTNTGANKQNVRSVVMTGNLGDLGGCPFRGPLIESVYIAGVSNIGNSSGTLIDLQAGSRSSSIIGARVGGILEGAADRLPNNCINIETTAANPSYDITIMGAFGPCERNAIQIFGDGVAYGIKLIGCSFDRPAQTTGAGYTPIAVFNSGGTLTRVELTVLACSFDLTGTDSTVIVGGTNSAAIEVFWVANTIRDSAAVSVAQSLVNVFQHLGEANALLNFYSRKNGTWATDGTEYFMRIQGRTADVSGGGVGVAGSWTLLPATSTGAGAFWRVSVSSASVRDVNVVDITAAGISPVTSLAANLGTSAAIWLQSYVATMFFGDGTRSISSGSGSPEGVVTAPIGSLYTNTAGGASTTLYVKTSGAGNTGWTAK